MKEDEEDAGEEEDLGPSVWGKEGAASLELQEDSRIIETVMPFCL